MKPFFRMVLTAAALASAGLCHAQDAPPPPTIADVPADYTPPVYEGPELIAARFLQVNASSSILAKNAQAIAQAEIAAPPKSIPVKELPEAVPPAKAQPEAATPQMPKVEYHTHYHITPAAPSYAQPETAVPAAQTPSKVRHPGGVRRVAARLGRGLENWGSRTWIAVDSPTYQVTPVVNTTAKYVVANPTAVQQERSALASPQAPGR